MSETNGCTTELEGKIIKQVEYYFGDINLARDKFLQEQIKEDNGWVAMATMLNFNRLKNICDDTEAICKALKKSESGLMEVSEDNTKIRRSEKCPLPENSKERNKEINERSVYVKGFPLNASLDQIMEFMEKFGKIESVFMRRDAKKDFKGSVFSTFQDKNDIEKFLKDDNVVKFDDNELMKRTKDDYYKSKEREMREKREEAQKQKMKNMEQKIEEQNEKLKSNMTEGAVVELKGFTEDVELSDLKNFFNDYGKVAWVDYFPNTKLSTVRFDGVNSAKTVITNIKATHNEKVVVNNMELECRILEGEEEIEHWKQILKEKTEKRNKDKNRSFNKKGRGYQGRRSYGKHKDSSQGDDEPATKKAKADD